MIAAPHAVADVRTDGCGDVLSQTPTLGPSLTLRLLSASGSALRLAEKPPAPTGWGVYPPACQVTLYPGAKSV